MIWKKWSNVVMDSLISSISSELTRFVMGRCLLSPLARRVQCSRPRFIISFWDLPSHWIVSELAGKNCDFENWRTWQWDKASYQNRVSIEISSYTFLQKSISIKLEKLVLSRCFRLKILRSKSPYKDKYHSIGLRSLLVHWWDRMYKMTSY